MFSITQQQRQEILDHMIAKEDSKTRTRKYKARKNDYDTRSIEINELEEYKKEGWVEVNRTRRKVFIQKLKEPGRKFEHDIWCMFRDLGFEILNLDENLKVQWGPNSGDHQQLDIVAVREDSIFVVECKATANNKWGSFKKDIESLKNYKDGVTQALQEIYGNKRVKFLFATRGYNFREDSEDLKRLKELGVYHFNENSYKYVDHLIKAYKTSVIYQFMGLMFKDELIDDHPLRIPALEGEMGGHKYYMLAIEPGKLLKIGFVLHRTKVNESMAPTYQRLLLPSRLKGIAKFIDAGGYFPNSIIVNFDLEKKGLELKFEPEGGENSRFGNLVIPNAYGIAYIIDGQHRLYGYANSNFKDTNTIPVVAFNNMDSQEQLKIFMDINENQKAVSPTLRLDLNEDINWESSRLDSRMSALRSSIIKQLAYNTNSILNQKISVGEDSANLKFRPFDSALKNSSLLPKVTQTQYREHQDVCLYDINLADNNKAMENARDEIFRLINEAYSYLRDHLKSEVFEAFILCNRGTYATIVVLGNINEYLIKIKEMAKNVDKKTRFENFRHYLDTLCDYFNTISDEDKNKLFVEKGAGADTLWLRMFQNAIQKQYANFNPEGLVEWQQTMDENIQEKGKKIGEKIEAIIKKVVFRKLEQLYGDNMQLSIQEIWTNCLIRINQTGENISTSDWRDYVTAVELKDIIEKHWLSRKENDPDNSFMPFSQTFNFNPTATSKKEQLKWLYDFLTLSKAWSNVKSGKLTNANVEELENILVKLAPLENI